MCVLLVATHTLAVSELGNLVTQNCSNCKIVAHTHKHTLSLSHTHTHTHAHTHAHTHTHIHTHTQAYIHTHAHTHTHTHTHTLKHTHMQAPFWTVFQKIIGLKVNISSDCLTKLVLTMLIQSSLGVKWWQTHSHCPVVPNSQPLDYHLSYAWSTVYLAVILVLGLLTSRHLE